MSIYYEIKYKENWNKISDLMTSKYTGGGRQTHWEIIVLRKGLNSRDIFKISWDHRSGKEDTCWEEGLLWNLTVGVGVNSNTSLNLLSKQRAVWAGQTQLARGGSVSRVGKTGTFGGKSKCLKIWYHQLVVKKVSLLTLVISFYP